MYRVSGTASYSASDSSSSESPSTTRGIFARKALAKVYCRWTSPCFSWTMVAPRASLTLTEPSARCAIKLELFKEGSTDDRSFDFASSAGRFYFLSCVTFALVSDAGSRSSMSMVAPRSGSKSVTYSSRTVFALYYGSWILPFGWVGMFADSMVAAKSEPDLFVPNSPSLSP